MRRTVFLLLTLALLTVPVCAVQLPGELLDALPEEAAALAEGEGITEDGVQLLVQSFFDALRASLDRSLRGAVLLALTVLLTGAADGFASSLGENASRFVPLVGVLCVTTLSAGDLSSLIGLGTATMQDLADLFFPRRRRNTRFLPVSWAGSCVKETGSILPGPLPPPRR